MLHKGAGFECNAWCRTEIRAPQNQLCLSILTMVSRGALDKLDRLCPSLWMSDPIVMDRRAMEAIFGSGAVLRAGGFGQAGCQKPHDELWKGSDAVNSSYNNHSLTERERANAQQHNKRGLLRMHGVVRYAA